MTKKRSTEEINNDQMQLQSGANHTAMLKAIAKDVRETIELEKQRTLINEQMALIRERVVSRGIPKKSFAHGVAYFKLDAEKREGLDEGYSLVREALNLPFNSEPTFFDYDGDPNDDNPRSDPDSGGAKPQTGEPWPDDVQIAAANANEQAEGDKVLSELAPSLN